MKQMYQLTTLSNLLKRVERFEDADPLKEYHFAGTYSFGRGIFAGDWKLGTDFRLPKVQRIYTEDFVYCKIMAWEGAFGLVPKEADNCVMSGAFVVYEIDRTQVDPKYLAYYFKVPSVWKSVGSQSTGTNVRRRSLHPDQFEKTNVPLPSLEEQRRIVARIEELAARIEEARGLRREAVEEAEILLSEAVTGILDDKQWTNLTLGSLLRENSRNGLSAFPSDIPLGTPILRISAATSRQDAIIDEQDYKYIELDERDVIKYKVEPGDLLACRFNGNLRYVGKFALYKGYSGKTQVYPDKLIRFRLDTEKVSPEFVRYAVNSPVVRKSIEAFCATTAGNIGISAGDLKTITIPVPPISEQKRIATYLDDLQSKLDSLKQLQSETSAELNALLPSILDKAFKGEL